METVQQSVQTLGSNICLVPGALSSVLKKALDDRADKPSCTKFPKKKLNILLQEGRTVQKKLCHLILCYPLQMLVVTSMTYEVLSL